MNKIYLITSLILVVLAGGCSTSIEGKKYREMAPQLDLFTFFNSDIKAWGIVQDRSGNVIQRFTVDIEGEVEGQQLVLRESFSYQLGEGPKTRTWRIEQKTTNEFVGSAGDISGTAKGISYGNAFQFSYRMDLPVGEDTYDVGFDDWFFAMDERTIMNRSYIHKFGLVMAEVTIFMQQV